MKFGKEFASQMVQEWQTAYMDYNSLKNILKDIMRFRQRTQTAAPTPAGSSSSSSLKRRVSLYRAFSGLTNRYNNFRNSHHNDTFAAADDDDHVILVNAEEGSGPYQTKFMLSSEEGGQYEAVFFKRLDEEFNKVVKFYKDKVDEVMKDADNLTQQMDALIALRIKVDITPISIELSKVPAPAATGRRPGRMDIIEEVDQMDSEGGMVGKEQKKTNNSSSAGFRRSPIEVLDHVKMNVEAETPVSTMMKLLKSSNSDLNCTKGELRKVEDILRQAFAEFYKQLRLLKNYSFLNQMAFSKIMKKYDKITSRNASKAYLQMVDKSYLGSSDEVSKLIERVESTFIKHFSNGNRRKGMKTLKPQARREKHRTTFVMGLFVGCAIALLLAVIVIIQVKNILNSPGRQIYMDNIFPLYSFFGLIILHMLMYAGNLFFWRRYRVNYSFIFGFKPGTELGYRQVLLLASGLSLVTLAAVISNLEMEIDPRTKNFPGVTELVPLALLLLLLLITFCPFNILYHSSRFFLIKCAFHSFLAPLYKVTLPDFFLADQLTSQVQALRSLQFYICYYMWGDFRRRNSSTCLNHNVFKIFTIIVAVIPYWLRFLQCMRRLVEEKGKAHIFNGLKYFLTIVAITARTGNELKWGNIWLITAWASSIIVTILATYWDIVIDWGLLRIHSKNALLRDKLVIPHKTVYFVAIVLNMILRLAWMQSVMGIYNVPILHRQALIVVVACLEIIRRGIWNFFRLENEHLNNVGKYRAFKSVPLPFYYDQSTKHP
ncbi:phosphate transporter PHO1 homolog 9-like [Impatiens glandulifera]|uniref:phosphate transporter PHO1 homolog 9-like n=1 Tax=Impatiens glandulifera TaxID=253017 RepID=UPI001FB13E43|nr:phosphate transporter PHO1 homolog 9-like [Impatiens glandulifera]